MSQNITKSDTEKSSPIQAKAIELVFVRRNQTQIAAQVDVGRETVSHWINHDEEFQAAFHLLRINSRVNNSVSAEF